MPSFVYALSVILIIFGITGCTKLDEKNFKSPIEPETLITDKAENSLETKIPKEINLPLTFYPQAPDGDWGEPWQEACEESSITLAYYGIKNKELSKEQFKKTVLQLVDWQNKNFGDYKHSSVDQTAEMLKSVFEFSNFEVMNDPTIEDLKKELSQGRLIVAPFAGRQLGNPFYNGQGPTYHMIVIRGYDEKNFITNDVGTRRGENFVYSYEVMMNALHDWHEKDINLGKKKVLIFKR